MPARQCTPGRPSLVRLCCLALLLVLAGCSSLGQQDPLNISVVGIEPLPGQGMEMRFSLTLRVQNPNDGDLAFDGIALDMQINDQPLATGVSDQQGQVPRFGETLIKNGVKTDNQVHIAHNVVVGENTLLVAQVGIAGSTVIGDHAILAGQAGIAGHLIIGNNAVIGLKAGVTHSVADHEVVSGVPAIPHKQWLKAQTVVARLPELKKRVNELEKKINALEEKGETL